VPVILIEKSRRLFVEAALHTLYRYLFIHNSKKTLSGTDRTA